MSAGKTETRVCLRIGPWTLFLASDTQGRFREADKVLPSLMGPITTWKLAEQDALFLAKALPRLPGRELEDAPTTVDLNGRVAVRAQGEGQSRITEVVLSQSEVGGGAVCFRVNRQYLARTLRLGFRELCITKADVPVVCRDAQRMFVWCPCARPAPCRPPRTVQKSRQTLLATISPRCVDPFEIPDTEE